MSYVNISEGQKEKLQHAIKAGCSAVSIRLGREDLKGNDIIAITKSQAKKLVKAHENGTGITIRMSSSQPKHNKKIEGGFLGLQAGLAARALPMITKTILPALGVGAHWEYKKRWGRMSISKKEDGLAKCKRMVMDYT